MVVLLGVSGCPKLHRSELTVLKGTCQGRELGPNTDGLGFLFISGQEVEFRELS